MNTVQRKYEIINIPHDFLHTIARRLASSRSWPHIVAVLKLKNCNILKGSPAQTLQFWSLVTTIPVWCKDARGSPMKIAAKVYNVKSMGTKMITQHFRPCTWHFHTSSEYGSCTHTAHPVPRASVQSTLRHTFVGMRCSVHMWYNFRYEYNYLMLAYYGNIIVN